jgi:endonuclease G
VRRQLNPFAVFLGVVVAVVCLVILLRFVQDARPPEPVATSTEQGEPPAPQPPEREPSPPVTPPDNPDAHLTMGNPSNATEDAADRDNYLMRKPYFALSYNNTKGTPNWVSWRLRGSDLGSAERATFYTDSDLPKGFKHITPMDYTGSGFDRGHLCPRSDRTNSATAARATFAMTNIIPQSPAVNQKAWNELEEYCRDLVGKRGQTLYIVAGPQGEGGTGTKGSADSIARGRVTVPAKCWKVVLALKDGGGEDDVRRVGADTRVISVIMPNDETVGHGWGNYRTSVKEVETLTGYRLFDKVPAEVSGPLKEKVDQEQVPNARRTRSRE